jgi:hypothetical protein
LINPCWCIADDIWDIQTSPEELKKIADGTLTLMAFTVLPDITTSSLSISNANTDNPGIWQTTFGGGFTIGKKYPLYIEGSIGYSRYDPEFIATSGQEQRWIPIKWNSFATTGGIGWNFPLTANEELKLRPIFNFTLGYVTTDVALGQDLLNLTYDLDLNLIDDGRMNAYGLGGSVVLDYKRYRVDYEIDVEARYTLIRLQTYGGTTEYFEGSSETNSFNLWARWRAPIGVTFLKRPLRYVLESSFTAFFGPQRGALGFDNLASVGAGIELDTSAYRVIISRARMIGRYIFGDNLSGYSLGLAVSF